MKKLRVSLNTPTVDKKVGELAVIQTRGREHYQFVYDAGWCTAPNGFAIDPLLELMPGFPHNSETLWGCFQDIAPDRWGELVQDRVAGQHLHKSDYLLGVSDAMRMGALRLSEMDTPEIFLADHQDVPKLLQLNALQDAVLRLERGQETTEDMQMLADTGSSIGGARPKAVVEDRGVLWIAKFPSTHDTQRAALWEATMLDMAKQAGIRTAEHKVINPKGEKPVLLIKRFDRQYATNTKLGQGGSRIHFASAMTLLGYSEQQRRNASYLNLADVAAQQSCQPKIDQQELWRRMVFNAMAGNTDDHLRNHAFLREKQGWRLSPAYDLNPAKELYERRRHALSFDSKSYRPELEKCIELAAYFAADTRSNKHAHQHILTAVVKSLQDWKKTAQKNSLTSSEINSMSVSFEHKGVEALFSKVLQHKNKLSKKL